MHTIAKKYHNVLLYCFVLFLPFQTVWIVRDVIYSGEKWQYGTIGIYLSDIFLVMWILADIYCHADIISQWMQSHKKIFVTFVLCVLWIFTSVFWADDMQLVLYHALLFFAACSMTMLLYIMPRSLTSINIAILVGACLHALIGIQQFLTQHTFAHSYIGTQFHDVAWGGTATISVHGERWLRAYGGMPHPNMLGGLLLIALLVAITIYITEKNLSVIKSAMLLSAHGILTCGMLMTFSRTTWLITCASLAILFIFFIFSTKSPRSLITPAMTILSTFVIFTLFFGHIVFSRVTHDTQLSHNSFEDRKTYIAHAKTLILQHPLVGTGIGNYTNTAYEAYQRSHPIWYFQPVHNMYLLMIAEIGIVGFTLIVFLFITTIRSISRTHILSSPYNATYVIICAALSIAALGDHWLWSSHFGILFFALFVGLAMTKKDADNARP